MSSRQPFTVYLSRKAEGKHSSNLIVGKLIECFNRRGVNYTFAGKQRWDAALALINCDDVSLFKKGPVIQRLDGIYFNTDNASMSSNVGIKRTYLNSKGVIFQSNLAKAIVTKNFGPHPGKNVVITNGTIIEDKIDPHETLREQYPKIYSKIASYNKRIICVGKWRQIKRLSSIIEGSLEYIKSHPDACLIVVGPTDGDNALNKYQSENIIRLGQVKNDTVRHLQMISHCCLNLSFTDSCPSSVIEALANGTPCVITKHQGVVDVIKDGKDGVILDLDIDRWDYGPVSYNNHIKKIPAKYVAEAIDKCVKLGRLPFRYDLDVNAMADNYIDFLQSFKR